MQNVKCDTLTALASRSMKQNTSCEADSYLTPFLEVEGPRQSPDLSFGQTNKAKNTQSLLLQIPKLCSS